MLLSILFKQIFLFKILNEKKSNYKLMTLVLIDTLDYMNSFQENNKHEIFNN